MTDEVKVGVTVPCASSWHPDFGAAVVLMTAYFVSNPPTQPVTYHFMGKVMSHLPMLRTALVKGMLDRGATHILCLDCDMSFPWDTLNRLLAHNKPIVAANYIRKVHPYTPVAIGMDGLHCFTTEAKKGLEPVQQVGMGVMLIEASVFDDLPEPWFPMGWSEARKGYIGEDTYFCHLARKRKGIDVFIDHDLSKEVLHLGSFGYGYEITESILDGASDLRRPDDKHRIVAAS